MSADTESETAMLFEVPTPGLSRRALSGFANRLVSKVSGGRTYTCLVTGDSELRRLNREFRRQDHATDVLSFPAALANGFLGDIAISFERAKRQATEYGHSVQVEIEILMLHGLLHLLGMDHESDRGQMAQAENKWRVALGLPRGLIARAADSL
jgi:probable rRNA maturation factor